MASPDGGATTNTNVPIPVPFPQPDSPQPPSNSQSETPNTPSGRRSRTSTNASTGSRIRAASVKLMEAAPPAGMWAATGTVTSRAPTLSDIRRGSFSESGWNEEPQRQKAERARGEESATWMQGNRGITGTDSDQEQAARTTLNKGRSNSSNMLNTNGVEPFPAVTEVTEEDLSAHPTATSEVPPAAKVPSYDNANDISSVEKEEQIAESAPTEKKSKGLFGKSKEKPGIQRQYTNGYVPPAKVPWKESTIIGLKGFWKWFLTIPGFLITLYGLNVVAWGGMLFLLLCNAAPAMCKPTCNDIQSPRRIWIEIDSQVLNGLFCVTGFGLAPWRFRDLYWWAWWRIGGKNRTQTGIRRLAGIHNGWFRLPGSQQLPPTAGPAEIDPFDPAVPIPANKTPDAPPTAHRAPPTKGWKMDFVVWMNVMNTFFQVVLCFYMYNYNRYKRPSWATGTFVALGCIVAGLGGIMMFVEGKHIKAIEGVPIPADAYKKPGDLEVGGGGIVTHVPTEHVPAETKTKA